MLKVDKAFANTTLVKSNYDLDDHDTLYQIREVYFDINRFKERTNIRTRLRESLYPMTINQCLNFIGSFDSRNDMDYELVKLCDRRDLIVNEYNDGRYHWFTLSLNDMIVYKSDRTWCKKTFDNITSRFGV